MNELESIIKQKPLIVNPNERVTICPGCASDDVTVHGHTHTLVGSMNPGYDPNHHWIQCKCNVCCIVFTHEYKIDNDWYTVKTPRGTKVIYGISNCYEDYIYDCAKCEIGEIRRQYTDLDKKELPNSILRTKFTDEGPVKQYRTFYCCDSCDVILEVDE